MDIQDYNKQIIDEFRANGGTVGGQFANAQLLLLTTVGAKTGQARVNPLAYFNDGDRYLIVASYAGAPTNPPWYFNLVANPTVEVEVGNERFSAMARVLAEPERTEQYAKIAAASAAFAEYARKTSRAIPVIALRRA